MSRHSYVTMPGRLQKEDWLSWSNWVPNISQMWAALSLKTADAVDPFERGMVTVTMRQGIGMIALLGLLAGVIPLIANLWLAVPMRTSVPLAQVADAAAQFLNVNSGIIPLDIAGATVQTIAGTEPRMPGIFAALLSALGIWINWPLGWLANWIVYGTVVFALARLMGATNTLQSFFAATSFTAVPLLLTGLAPIPCVGPLAGLLGMVLAFAVYFQAMRFVTRLDGGRTVICMLLPPSLVVVVPMMLIVLAAFLSIFQ